MRGDARSSSPSLPQQKAVPVKAVPVTAVGQGRAKKRDDAAAHRWKPSEVTWPKAGSAKVALRAEGAEELRAGDLPVRVAPAGGAARNLGAGAGATFDVSVADRARARQAGAEGALVSLRRTDSAGAGQPLNVTVDYSAYRNAFGGDFASRLRLVELPECAWSTPTARNCGTGKPLATRNDTEAGTLTAEVTPPAAANGIGGRAPAPATVLAVAAEAGGSSGTYKATTSQPSGSWSSGGSTGAFTWRHPISVPAVPGGLQPGISLDYSSQAVDGRTAASNNQPSWIGDGWDWQPGYIERRYKACDDDKDKAGATNTTRVGDLCWYTDNAVLSLNGKSTELVHESGKGWHPAEDSGDKVEKLTGASNGDQGTSGVDGAGEHWKITTTDGTQYFFGRNRLPGWSEHGSAADDPVTNSTWTVPVFGNQPGEPCHAASFASAWCRQAWRWQLDYVVDPRGNAIAYYWNQETNHYGRNFDENTGSSTNTSYVRGGYLDHIDYGLRSDAVYTGKAMGQVYFKVSERCLTGCSTFDEAHAANWPDTPQDRACASGTECKDQYSPSFWSRMRLTGITTKVLTAGAYKDVDSWTLAQDFPASGDGISTPMWLRSITRTGKAGGTAAMPPVTFSGEQMANRVDKTGDGLAPFVRLRLSEIITEAGGGIGVTYSPPGCTAASLPPTDAGNGTRCYPVKWAFEGSTASTDWFNSYVATEVVESDNLADTPDTSTKYAYVADAQWDRSTDAFLKPADRTYSVARGYGRVQTRKGAGAVPATLTETRYFRGTDGAAVPDSSGASVTDREQFAGMVREQATYHGDTGALVSATSFTPWRSAATATKVRKTSWDDGLPDLVAYRTGTQKEQTRTTVTGGERKTSLTRTFDGHGMVATVSETGDEARSGDEKCTTTTYNRNDTAWILSTVARVEMVAVACGSTVSRPADVIGDTRTYHDGATSLTTAPSKGLVTRTEQINGAGNGYDAVSTTAPGDYDIYGRALKITDVYGKSTTTAYKPATGEVATEVQVTNALGHRTTSVLDPLRNQPTSVTDANGRVTTSSYDPLGRVVKMWTPAHTAAAYPDLPSYTFGYEVRRDAPVVVTTKVLNHENVYRPSYVFYDGLMRQVGTQAPSPDGSGRLVNRILYDSRGLAWHDSGSFYATGAAEGVMVTGQELNYPAATESVYDRAGRVTAVISRKFGDETKRMTTTYAGDSTTVIPPSGGTAVRTVVDALGRKVRIDEYTDAGRATFQSTSYEYNRRGSLAKVKDASGATWTYEYDVRGRQVRSVDPDKGATVSAYDAGDRATDVTDARQVTLHTDYDALGRKTALKRGTALLATWEYDTATGGRGQLGTATRFDGPDAYSSKVTAYSTLYKPTAHEVTIPATTANGGLAGTYKWTTAYYRTGEVKWTKHPGIGGLPAEEQVETAYNPAGLPVTLYAGASATDALVSSTTYDHYGRDIRKQQGDFDSPLVTTNTYDEHTGLLNQAITDRDAAPQRVIDTGYGHDPAGNITKLVTGTGQDAARQVDTQCFTTDALRRITRAWTATDDCAAAPSGANVGGPDAYWTSYTYDAVGNRGTETQHATGTATGDTTRTYTAPPTGTHALPSVTTTGPSGAMTESYGYDEAGNTTKRSRSGNVQSLTWDAEGHLATTTEGARTTSYLYGTDGQRLIRRDSTGTTLYLPDGTEAKLTNGTVTGTRYYSFAGRTVAMRTAGKITFLLADHHGTTTTQIDAATQAVVHRRSHIFGAVRGTPPASWTGDKGFVGGTDDTDTGLVHLGAREYDPATARFISVDPLFEIDRPQTYSGYSYGANNPLAFSDPTGKGLACGGRYESCGSGVQTHADGSTSYRDSDGVSHATGGKPRSVCYSACNSGPGWTPIHSRLSYKSFKRMRAEDPAAWIFLSAHIDKDISQPEYDDDRMIVLGGPITEDQVNANAEYIRVVRKSTMREASMTHGFALAGGAETDSIAKLLGIKFKFEGSYKRDWGSSKTTEETTERRDTITATKANLGKIPVLMPVVQRETRTAVLRFSGNEIRNVAVKETVLTWSVRYIPAIPSYAKAIPCNCSG
ncbi:RHS repeat-associated protein [Nonomuraea thailandensis]|uniref:RHS repeat-associated protein n=1 Tax=Nonomuraea thailandensis TaxID=1188745 RepID=A0A9X2K1K6_9ACTN|nr:RHS repeat-associated core domain-containing protein [Nonomuraea thailandensis]MCP2357412.1 RHS repeat-associated protein [Nonomuraea thailandensis]